MSGTLLESFLGKLAASIAWKGAEYLFEERFFMPLFMYRRSVRQDLQDMPFIYKDLHLDLVQDFVDVDISTIDKQTFESRSQDWALKKKAPERIRDHRRALLFGDGGFGKTTFFRSTAIDVLEKTRSGRMFEETESLVPIFVPLKAVRNSSQNPIVDAITENNSYFRGKFGYRRLLSLARKRKLIVFLDGYDETPYAGGFDSVLHEMSLIFSPLSESLGARYSSEIKYQELYTELRNCRVYLSSRREFYISNAFDHASDIPGWKMEGVGDRRGRLVENIFRKYKGGDALWLSEKLNYEHFMQQLIVAGDDGLRSLANSPLFLTVMCYVYVSDLRDGRALGSVFREGSSDLVLRCIRLLIEDIDKFKARGLKETERSALTGRRSSFPEEKLALLKYVASESYKRRISVFSERELDDIAREFFSQHSRSSDAKTILANVASPDATCNIVKQLIFSGVFVVAAKRGDEFVVDFPHRRFREALAVEYFDSPEGLKYLAERVDQADLSELLLYFVDQTNFKREMIDALAKKLVVDPTKTHLVSLFMQCLAKCNDGDYCQDIARTVLSEIHVAESNLIPSAFIGFLPNDGTYIDYLESSLQAAIIGDSPEDLVRWALPLVVKRPARLTAVFTSVLAAPGLSPRVIAAMLDFSSRFAQESAHRVIGYAVRELDEKDRSFVIGLLVHHCYVGRDANFQKSVPDMVAGAYGSVDAEFAAEIRSGRDLWDDLLVIFAGRKGLVKFKVNEDRFTRAPAQHVPSFWS